MTGRKGPNSEESMPAFAEMRSEEIVEWLRQRIHPLPNGSFGKAVEKAVEAIHDHHYREASELLARLTKDRKEMGTNRSF